MRRLMVSLMVVLCVTLAQARASDERIAAPAAPPNTQDMEVIAVMEILNLLELAEELDMVKEMDHLAEEKNDAQN